MENMKRRWRKVPVSIRKPIVLIVGLLFIVVAGLTGWLPGPGGIPLFLVGIAILSTEFVWARKIRDVVVKAIQRAGKQLRAHKIIGTVLIILAAALAISLSVFIYRKLQ